jgi:hypothetical protein
MPAKREVEVYRPDKTLYKRYSTMTEMSIDMGANLSTVSAEVRKEFPRINIKGIEYTLVFIKNESDFKAETEDEIRRRLGLNPYGEWRNDEWLNAMFERVNKLLYPDGYDPRETWLAQKANDRASKRTARIKKEKESEDVFYNSIEDFDENN